MWMLGIFVRSPITELELWGRLSFSPFLLSLQPTTQYGVYYSVERRRNRERHVMLKNLPGSETRGDGTFEEGDCEFVWKIVSLCGSFELVGIGEGIAKRV